jgi:TolB protein
MMRTNYVIPALACFCLALHGQPVTGPRGIFEDHADVGTVLHAGSVEYDPAKRTYTIAGSGENMWFAADAFQFAWKKVSGDVTLTADISFAGAGAEAHRKAVLMIRQSLDADSTYADVARHGDGLTSLQARDEKGVNTTEIQSAMKAPARVRITRRGDYFFIWVAGEGEDLRFSGGSMRVPMHDPVYVGLGVCSHNKDVVEKAVFSNVDLTIGAGMEAGPAKLYSTLETVPVSGDRRAVYAAPGRLSDPAWTSDGAAIIFRTGGRTAKIPAAGGKPEDSEQSGTAPSGPVATDKDLPSDGYRNYSPSLSPDGQQIAFLSSAGDSPGIPEDKDVMLRVVSVKDGKVRVLAKFIGGKASIGLPWSPDSRRLAFVSYQWIH